MTRTTRCAGLALTTAAAALVLAPAAHAASATPRPSAPRTPVLRVTAVPSPVPSARPTVGGRQGGGGDIDVPAGRASVPAPAHGDELLLVALAGGGALLLAGGSVVAVARRRT